MADGGLSACDGWCSPQLRIVLLGGRNSGKNAVGNLLLGKEEFVAREGTSSSRRLGVVAGRWLTVVDTPGWWCDFSARDTTRLVKREIVSGVSLCSPGPHVFLVVLKASSAFSERRRRAVEEHVALLGEGAWDHCIVVLAAAAERGQVEGREGRGREALRWLVEKCGQRCHSVNLDDGAEAARLLGAIRSLVAENGNRAYEVQEDVLRANAEEERAVETRAQLRLARVKERRSLMRERLRPVTDIRIVLLGAKGSGKTSALNTILGRGSGVPPGRTARCRVGRGVVFGRELTVVDTPGWWMNYFCGETPAFDRRELVLSLSLCPPGPHVFLLAVRADRAFTETYRRAAQEHLELIGGRIWSRVLLLFTFGDWPGGTAAAAERHVESEGAALGWLAGKCGDRYHVLDTGSKGGGFQVRELIGKLEEMMMTGWDDRSWHYEIERKALEQLDAGVRRERERAEERLTARRRRRRTAKSLMEKLNPSPELRLVLVGGRKSGKSSCGNTILGEEAFDADAPTTSCAEKRGSVGGRTVTVLDTPGRFPVTSDLLTPTGALLLVVNASASFTDAHAEAFREQLDAVGGARAAVLFSHGDWLGDTSVEERIESEGEPLRRLVDECGNRYHVLDNTCRDRTAQVSGLVELLEEMAAGERMDALRRRQHVCDGPSSTGGGPPDVDLTEATGDCHQLLPDVPASPTSSPASDASQVVALRPRRGAGFPAVGGLLSHVAAAALSGRLKWAGPLIDLQLRLPPSHLRPSVENRLVPAGHAMTLVLSSQQQQQQDGEEEGFSVHTLCHPALRERTLRKLWERGGLQALIDQWGDSSLAELEAFIDSYFEMVWEQTMGSLRSTETDSFTTLQQEEEQEEEEQEVLSSIDRKLSKLELLEEIKSDLGELRQSLERSWRAIEELRHKNKHGPNNTK